MYTQTIAVKNHNELYQCLCNIFSRGIDRRLILYRGQSEDWSLIPSLFREDNKHFIREYTSCTLDNNFDKEITYRSAEDNMLMRFYIYANRAGLIVPDIARYNNRSNQVVDSFLIKDELQQEWLPLELAEIAALAQHYGLPTRLIDWTYDYNVALYFACINSLRKALSNNNYQAENIVIWLIDNRFFEQANSIEALPDCPIRFIVPQYSRNPNLRCQKGILSYWKEKPIPDDLGFEKKISIKPLDELINALDYSQVPKKFMVSHIMLKITMPSNECLNALEFLFQQGYSAASLFPGYRGIVMQMEEERIIKEAIKRL